MEWTAEVKGVAVARLGPAALGLASGASDVLSFLELGNLFTSGMTGNMALLAIAVGHGQVATATRSLSALVAFACGVLIAKGVTRTLRALLLLEVVVLGACAALWTANADALDGAVLYGVIALSALGMGIQAAAARTGKYAGVTTVVLTLNLVRMLSLPAEGGPAL